MFFAECYCRMSVWVCIVIVKSFDVFCELEGRVDLGEISKAAATLFRGLAVLRRDPRAAALQPCLRILSLVLSLIHI